MHRAQVEELKILIRIFPIWGTTIVFSAVYSQMSAMFIEQGMVMDRTVGSFTIPAASLYTFDFIIVIFWVSIYDQILVHIARKSTGTKEGFSNLQRIGIGHFISILALVAAAAAAAVEIRRLQLAKKLDLVNENAAVVPLTILWQIPQFVFVSVAEAFMLIGAMEFFYDQSPDAMRNLYSALFLLTILLGSYLSSLILKVLTAITTAGGRPRWIPDNLDKGLLDNYFWLLVGLSFFNTELYVICAMRYVQKKASS